jgi:hypothetical protein
MPDFPDPRSRRRIALPLLLAAALAAAGGCASGQEDQQRADRPRPDQPDRTRTHSGADGQSTTKAQAPNLPVRFAATPGLAVSPAAKAQLLASAKRFAVSLTRWLYGDRDSLTVAGVTATVRRRLDTAPPFIPDDQRNTSQGRMQMLEVALQAARSGIVTVTINDLRTSYRVPANFERRGGRWLIVSLGEEGD